MAKAVIAGGSGFIGKNLAAALRDSGYQVVLIGRDGPEARWGDLEGVRRAINGSDVLINMAGKSVDCRYNDANRKAILRSRLETTRQLREAAAAASSPPAVWLNSSTATIYRYAMDRPMTESGGELGTGFSVDVARNWERELFESDLPETRLVALRIAIVLGDGPAVRRLRAVTRFGLGGAQYDGWWFQHKRYRGIGPDPSGDGKVPQHRSRGDQRFSWIHIDDVVGAVQFIVANEQLSGPINLSAPNPTDNTRFMAAMRSAMGKKIGLPAYRWMLEPAMVILRSESELVLKSRWVLPEKLVGAGYEFKWPYVGDALADVLDDSKH